MNAYEFKPGGQNVRASLDEQFRHLSSLIVEEPRGDNPATFTDMVQQQNGGSMEASLENQMSPSEYLRFKKPIYKN